MKSAIAKTPKTAIKSDVTTKTEPTKKPDPDVRVVKAGVCPSLSGKSDLGYEFGGASSNDLRLRIVANSGAGSFRQEWVELRSIRTALDREPRNETVTSDCLLPLFREESANMPSFVFAVLLREGLVRRSVKEKRRYERAEPEAFDAAAKALMEGKGAAGTDAKGHKAKGKKVEPEKKPSASTKNKK